MSYWLLKTEPGTYSWDDLARDGKAVWDGVSNPVALKNIRSMSRGDLVLIYHTGDERAAVGVAEVTSSPYADPKQDDEKLAVIDLKPKHKLAHPVTLDTMKSDPAFAGFDLLRIGRLSVVPVPEKMWRRIEALSKAAPEDDNASTSKASTQQPARARRGKPAAGGSKRR
jgi:predicted RNA-binding protein with PUA-like domain